VKTNAGWNNVAGVEESYGQGFGDDGNPTTQAHKKNCTSKALSQRGE